MFSIKGNLIPGCYEIQPNIFNDDRGRFIKIFHEDEYKRLGLNSEFSEEYYSVSHKGVIRGMHFQVPPFEHTKLIYCVQGAVRDVVLDLRKGSPSYGQSFTLELSADKGNAVYVPKGVAHGFCAITQAATLVYKVSTVHSSLHDMGIHWNSFGLDWGIKDPIISARDASFKSFLDFNNPFIYDDQSAQ